MAVLVLLIMLYLSISAEGRTWHNFKRFQYSIETTPVTSYAEAEMGCSALEANVANVKTREIFDFVKTVINLTDQPFSFYIGAKRVKNTDKFQWNDGSDVSVPTTMWDTGQPNNYKGIDTCVTMGFETYLRSPPYLWHDGSCTKKLARYICEKVFTEPNTTISPQFTHNIFSVRLPTDSTTTAAAKVNTVIIVLATSGWVIFVIFCVVVVFMTSRHRKRRRNHTEPVNVTSVINHNAEDNDAIRKPRLENTVTDDAAESGPKSRDVHSQVKKEQKPTKVHDNGQQSHVSKDDHNRLDEATYDTLQPSENVEACHKVGRGSNPTDIYNNRDEAEDESN